MNYYETLKTLDMEKLIRRNLARRKEKFDKKVKELSKEIQEKVKLESYIQKSTSLNIFEKIIANCLIDSQLSGVAYTKENEKILYKRTKKSIEFNINNSSFILKI